uniref:C-type lectin domain-containing protein n=1 Tax=Naja naja TaxID=35670 RepID=A0A8C6XJI2_NAJNA
CHLILTCFLSSCNCISRTWQLAYIWRLPIKCPGDWVGYAKHCYHLNRDGKTWKDASVSCQKDGGHLLSIHDIEEYSFVFSQLGYKPTDNLWIGLNDQKTFSYFEWSDGSTVRFIRWQKGEPTLISNVQEDCVIMSGKVTNA